MRLERTDASRIENLDAWLTTVVSRVCLDQLRSPRRTRERSWEVEPWRDEPLDVSSDPADAVAESDRISIALIMVLETLSPAERIAFVLHDVFGQPFDAIAEATDRSPAAARQLASRARRRLRQSVEPARAERRRALTLVRAWLAAVQDGDLRALLALLDDDAVLHADFGARTQVITGAKDIASQAVLMAKVAAHSMPVLIDGMPGIAATRNGHVVSIMGFELTRGRIVSLQVLADPDRLAELGVAGVLAPRS